MRRASLPILLFLVPASACTGEAAEGGEAGLSVGGRDAPASDGPPVGIPLDPGPVDALAASRDGAAAVETGSAGGVPYGQDLLQNGGFELGSLQGWADDGLPCELSMADSETMAAEGDYYVWGGAQTEDCWLAQRIELVPLGFPPELIDAGEVGIEADIWLSGLHPAGPLDDQARLQVAYLAGQGVELGWRSTLLGGGDSWVDREATGRLPVGTRALEVSLHATYLRGEANDAMADGLSVQLQPVDVAPTRVSLQPMLQDFRTDGMRLLWESDGNRAEHGLSWGSSETALTERSTRVHTVQIDEAHFVHVASIEGLEADQEVFYRVWSGADLSPVYGFRTAPAPGDAARIAWVGDNQDDPEPFRRHVRHIAARTPDLLIAPGDIVEDGDVLSDWTDFWFLPLEEESFAQTTPVLFARGNHDLHHAFSHAYSALPENEAWYSFTYGPVFFVILDTEINSGLDMSSADWSDPELVLPWIEQGAYLESVLASAEAQDAAWRVVSFHQSPFSNSRHGPGDVGNRMVRNHWIDIIEEGGVDLVVSGHYHAYERGDLNGVTYVVSGGGGATVDDEIIDEWDFFEVVEQVHHYDIMDVDTEQLVWTTYDLEEEIVDAFVLER